MSQDNSSEDVNLDAPEAPETPPVDVAKLQELERNKTIALENERKEKKALVEKLAELEAFKNDIDEKEKKKKGQYEELLTQKETLIKELQEKANKFDEYLSNLQAKQAEELEGVLKDVPENLKEKYSKIADKLDVADRIEFYKNIVADAKKEDFSQKPNGGKSVDSVEEFDILKTKVSTGKATPAERGQYLNLLRKKTNS